MVSESCCGSLLDFAPGKNPSSLSPPLRPPPPTPCRALRFDCLCDGVDFALRAWREIGPLSGGLTGDESARERESARTRQARRGRALGQIEGLAGGGGVQGFQGRLMWFQDVSGCFCVGLPKKNTRQAGGKKQTPIETCSTRTDFLRPSTPASPQISGGTPLETVLKGKPQRN